MSLPSGIRLVSPIRAEFEREIMLGTAARRQRGSKGGRQIQRSET
jgi:hypothetical protein